MATYLYSVEVDLSNPKLNPNSLEIQPAHREIDPESFQINPKFDCFYTFTIVLATNGIPFGAKFIGKV